MIVINMMMRSYFYIIILLVAFSCMEPNTESLWQLNKIVEIDTEGYCRDVYVSGDSVFLATGQAGIQLWDISNITSPILVWKKTLSDLGVNKEISQVEYKPSIKQLFARIGRAPACPYPPGPQHLPRQAPWPGSN